MSKTVSFYFPIAIDQRPLFLANPIKRIFTFQQNEVLKTLHQIDEWADKNKYFLAGYISYEAGYSLLGLKCDSASEIPLIDFYVFENQSGWEDPLFRGGSFFDFQVAETQENYKKNFSMIHHQQREGNTYQVNYTYQNACFSQGSSPELFYKLYSAQTTKYAALVQLLDFDILSISPELFFSKNGQTIQSKPMKGTLPLGVTDIDKKTFDKLQSENLMIVDLIRNDLSRFAKPETVRVKNLMTREQYPTLQQIVSTVEATLSEDTSFSEIICSLFPCGSITGAPKRKTMEIIQQLEKKPRGVYTGTIGYISPEQDMQFNVAIRTLVGRQHWSYGVGGGLVLDSACDDEWSESQLKKQFIPSTNSDFYLFETLLVKEGHVYDLELHLQRLSESARFFGFRYDEFAIRAQMLAAIPDKMNSYRLRAAIGQDGKIVVTLEPLQSHVSEARVTWSSQVTDSRDVFYRHKTSHRSLYEREFKAYREKGYYDVLFLNEKNQLTEASRHNVFISIDGQWYTPPLEVGVLNGVERQKQLKALKAKEKILFQSDVVQAQKVLLTNSVRGCIPVKVVS